MHQNCKKSCTNSAKKKVDTNYTASALQVYKKSTKYSEIMNCNNK